MAFEITRGIGRVSLCLAILLCVKARAFGLDQNSSRALSRYIMASMYENLGQVAKAIQEYQKALRADSENTAIHLGLASSYIKNNQIPEAMEELKLSAILDPEASQPHAILSLLYYTQNKPDLAQKEYEIALENASRMAPGNIEIYRNLGQTYFAQKRLKEAEQIYKLILGLDPADSQAHFYLANIYDAQQNRGEAIKELKKALSSNPDYHEALNYLGYVYVEENKNLAQAEAMIKKALEFEPDNGAYVDSLGWLYFKKAKFKEALSQLERAANLLDDPIIRQHLEEVKSKLNALR